MYIQLRSIKNVSFDGNIERCYPGDWVEVGKQTALNWIAVGDAWAPEEKIAQALPEGAGLLVLASGWDPVDTQALGAARALPMESDIEPRMPFLHTLLWDPGLRFPHHLAAPGFELLKRWQLVAPLWSYKRLAVHAGTEEDRDRAIEVLHDLRVPLYDTRLLFVRRLRVTERLLDRWEDWRQELSDARLAFLCALYQTKPVVCALPPLDEAGS
jgi:hypothetical protein